MVNEADRANVSLTFTTRCSIEGITGDLVLQAGSLAELRKALRAFPQAGYRISARRGCSGRWRGTGRAGV